MAMILKGQRIPSTEMIDALARDLALGPEEQEYFRLVVQLEKAKRRGKAVEHILGRIRAIHPDSGSRMVLDAKVFAYIAEWHHLVLKQLLAAPGFRFNPEKILKALRGKVTRAQLSQAIETLLSLGIIERKPGSAGYRVVERELRVASEVPAAAIRMHHRQMLERAIEAIEEQPIDRRELGAATLRMDPEKLPEAKQAIRAFIREFESRFSSKESARVFQLNLQLFEHTAGG